MPEVEIRNAVEEDAHFMFDLFKALAEHVGELDMFSSTLEDVQRDGFGPDSHYRCLIAEADGAPQGLSTYFFSYSTYVGRPCLFVLDLIVTPQARGAKLGTALMQRLSEFAVANDCCRIDLHVHEDNPSIAFYKAIEMYQTREVPFVLNGKALSDMAGR